MMVQKDILGYANPFRYGNRDFTAGSSKVYLMDKEADLREVVEAMLEDMNENYSDEIHLFAIFAFDLRT